MVTSQNGYGANDRSCIVAVAIPGGKLAVRRGTAAEFFAWLAEQYNARVEPLTWPGCWGYAERPIRGQTKTLSNHASGTAADFNAPLHPLGKRGTFKGQAAAEVRRLADEVREVCRWGGDYKTRPDEMHWELVVPEPVVAAWLARRRAAPTMVATQAQARSDACRHLPAYPLPAGHWFGVASKDPRNHSGYAAADRPHIARLLDAMRARGWKRVPLTDRYTEEVAELMGRYQSDAGLTPVDRLTGRHTWESVATSGVR